MKGIEQRPRQVRRAAGAGWAARTKVLRPAVLGPLLLSATLLVGLLTVGNVATIGGLVRHVHVTALVAIVLVLVGYEAARAAQWLVLLHGLHIRAPRRVQVFTYLVGEPTRVLPIGNFVENYLLLRAAGTSFGLSSVATLASVLLEVGAALLGLVLLGLGPWGWLRPLIVLGLATFVLGVWMGAHLRRTRRLPRWVTQQRTLRAALAEAHQFRHGAAALRQPRVLLSAAVLGGLYVGLGGTVLYLVARGLGVASLSWPEVLAVYCFSLASALILPLPVDVGVTETGGAAAFVVLGVDPSAAVGAMLLLRAITFGVALVIGLLTLAVLPDVTRTVLRGRPRPLVLSAGPPADEPETDADDADLARAG
jgi:uncharacterized membrane protein YbhN (UPF0104 family)